MAIALAVSTLSNISFLFGWLEFNLALLMVFNIKYVFVVHDGFEVHEEDREGELG
jgi:hypothetical protein